VSAASRGPGGSQHDGAADGLPEVTLAVGSVLVGDLHVDVEQPAAVEAFQALLAALSEAPRILFVGDVFEYWIGQGQAESVGGRRALQALAERTAAGTQIDLIPGNRDFLLGAAFERATGVVLRPRGLVGQTPDGGRVLVIHGDELCTRDRGYQRLRRCLRAPWTLALARRTPAPVARAIARRLRQRSRSAVAAKDPAIMAQDPVEVRRRAQAVGAGVLLCGHAHRFRDEALTGGPRWIVLDAFGGSRDLARVSADGSLEVSASSVSGGGYALGSPPTSW
jgi:UDP-2,3-diacylglucosamine hydrolase